MSRPTFAAIVTAHKDSPFAIMRNLAKQTVPPDEVIVGLSEYPLPWVVPSLPYPFTVHDFPYAPDYGYGKRNVLGLRTKCDYIGFFSHDDSYEGDYIEQMLNAVDKTRAAAAYCAWDDADMGGAIGKDCTFNTDSSTLGNFIMRRDLFELVGGFPAGTRGEGLRDGNLIELLRSILPSVARVNITLYHHNQPYEPGITVSTWGKERP